MDQISRTMGSKERHATRIQDLLYQQMSEHSEFCDVTLKIGEVEIKAHWCVLVSCPFFQSLYDSGMREKLAGTVNLNFGTPWAMREAIKFLYLGTVSVTFENVQELLEAAEYLQITDMKKCCSDYLYLIDISVDNCVNISLMASLYDLDLYNRAFQYVRGHLSEVMIKDDILTLTKDSIVSLLTDETLTYVPQEDFFSFILRWTNHDLTKRENYFPELFTCLDLRKVMKSFLDEVIECHPLVGKFEKCKVHVLNIKLKHLSGMIVDGNDKKEVILVSGGSGPGVYIGHFMLPFSDFMSVNNVFAYVLDEKRWTELAPLPYAMRCPMLVCDIDGNLFVCDNAHSLEGSVYIFQYKVAEKTWSSFKVLFPSNCENVSIQNMVCCANRIFFIASGVVKKAPAMNSTPSPWFCFLMEVNRCGEESSVKCKLFPRNPSTEVSTCCVGDMYICVNGTKCGDKTGKQSRKCIKFVYYDVILEKRFEFNKGMSHEHCFFPYGDGVMVAKPGKTNVRLFSFRERRWRQHRELGIPLPPENSDRSDYSYVGYGNEFYMFGGKCQETKQALKSVFKFKPETKLWTKLEDMPECLMGSGVCVGKLPADLVRCHINCPHCLYNTRRSQATYDITYSDDPDDDDYSYDDYSYEYSNHSYLWDDDDDEAVMDDDLLEPDFDYWAY